MTDISPIKYGVNYDNILQGDSAGSSNIDISDIALAVGLESMQAYDQKVQGYYEKVHKENVELANLNNAMEAAQTNADSPSGKTSDATFQYTDLSTDPPTTKDMSVSDFMDQMGISRPGDPDNYYDKNEWNTVLSNLKTESDTLSSTSQVDMMKLQSLLNKQQQAEAAASSIMKKADDAKTDNIRKW